MDYEWHIRNLERELAQLRELQLIEREHMAAYDKGFELVTARFERIETLLERTAVHLEALTIKQNELADKFNSLIEGRNGH